ncbi:unnamed protein product [Rotaria sp. Silwood1]|nr:unnamed protein product [Rotaria sp. Silwood1]
MILLINTTDCIHSYSIEYDQTTLTLKIHDDDDDLINNDEQSIINDKDENLEIECDDNNDLNDEYQKKEQYSNKILKRTYNNQEDNNIDILADRQLIGNVQKCVHIIAGLFEITPLNYTMHSSSDGTHLERVDMTHLLT